MSRSDEFHSGGHDNWCIEMAETVVREEMHRTLTAPAWDHAAMDRENEFVNGVAKEWLGNGTKDCECVPSGYRGPAHER